MLRVPATRLVSGKFAQRVAWKSTVAAASECPVTGAKSEPPKVVGVPQFQRVPAYPIVGSLIPGLSGIPVKFEPNSVYDFWPAMKDKFGEFYSMGLPTVGKGVTGELLVIQDPQVMMSLLRREGIYPTGSAQLQWANRDIMKEIGMGNLSGIFSQGPEWKRARNFIQTDLLSPKSARRYIPNILEAADRCSKAADHYQDDFKDFLDYSSLQMFYSIMFGTQLQIVDPTKERDPVALRFAQNVGKALQMTLDCSRSGSAYVLKTYMNYDNALYTEVKEY